MTQGTQVHLEEIIGSSDSKNDNKVAKYGNCTPNNRNDKSVIIPCIHAIREGRNRAPSNALRKSYTLRHSHTYSICINTHIKTANAYLHKYAHTFTYRKCAYTHTNTPVAHAPLALPQWATTSDQLSSQCLPHLTYTLTQKQTTASTTTTTAAAAATATFTHTHTHTS